MLFLPVFKGALSTAAVLCVDWDVRIVNWSAACESHEVQAGGLLQLGTSIYLSVLGPVGHFP
jgi:hypothetical protein